MKRILKYVVLALFLVGLVAWGGMPCKAVETPLGEPIRIAIIQPLSGECSIWGIPIWRTVEIYVEQLNADGGIVAGGKRHLVEAKAYDNICYIPAEELKLVKKAVLQGKAKFLFGTYTAGCRKATAPFLEKQGAIYVGYGGMFLRPEYPHTMAGITGCPLGNAPLLEYVINEHPEIKRVAIMNTDDDPDPLYWHEAASKAHDLEIVYQDFHPLDTVDYKPLITRILATEPDLILEHAAPQQAHLIETGMLLGYTGYWANGVSWEMPSIMARVPRDYVEGKLYSQSIADISDPFWPPECKAVYETYIKRYGEKEWSPSAAGCYEDVRMLLEVGIPAADSIDPNDVMKTLYALPEVDHPIFGKSTWGGKEIWGANHHLFTPVPIMKATGGELKTITTVDFASWWNRYKDVALPVLDKWGVIYHPED